MNQALSMGVSSEKQGSAGVAAGECFGCVIGSYSITSDFVVLLTFPFLGAHHFSEGPLCLPTWSSIPMSYSSQAVFKL